MRWEGDRQSENVDDRRGARGFGGRSIGIGTIVIALIGSWIFGVSPTTILNLRGVAVPDSFTHGTSAQRVRWFSRGMETGDVEQCDTFGATRL